MKELRNLQEICHSARSAEDPTPAELRELRAGLARRGLFVGAASAAIAGVGVAKTSAAAAASGSLTGVGAGTATGAVSTGAATAGMAGGAVASGTAAVAAKGLVLKGVLVLCMGGLAGGTAVTTLSRTKEPPAVRDNQREERLSPAVRAASLPAPAVAAADSAVVAPKAEPVTTPERRPAARPAPPSEAAPPARSLELEARALAAVQRALRDGRPADALSLLDAQARSERGGSLGAEREVARILALRALGREREARERSVRFLAAHPASPLSERIRSSVATDADAPEPRGR